MMARVSGEGTKILAGTIAGLASIMVFDYVMPPNEDIRASTPFNSDIESMEREALAISVGLVLITAGVMRSVEVFIIGGAVIIGVDFATKHANAINPDTGKMASPSPMTSVSTSFPMADYGENQAA
jgi:hypothetical protein